MGLSNFLSTGEQQAPARLGAAISGWIDTSTATPTAIAVDGRSLRGTFARAGVHLLSAVTHQSGIEPVQQQVTTGTTSMQPLPNLPDLAGALHTTRGLARYFARRDAHYVLTVKAIQHRLSALLLRPQPAGTGHQRRYRHLENRLRRVRDTTPPLTLYGITL
ncbi:hypothetical protein [Amycolatopsis sp. NPDC098790]|uniref:hypothetical protein n=1 Tax=Amycolatopsis sp. NPDC098790 TaxID=3363939 RepID=UPI0038163DF4